MNNKIVILKRSNGPLILLYIFAGIFFLIFLLLLFTTDFNDASEDEIAMPIVLGVSSLLMVATGYLVNKKTPEDMIVFDKEKEEFSIRAGFTLKQQQVLTIINIHDIAEIKYIPPKFRFYGIAYSIRRAYLQITLKNGKKIGFFGGDKPEDIENRLQRLLLEYRKKENL